MQPNYTLPEYICTHNAYSSMKTSQQTDGSYGTSSVSDITHALPMSAVLFRRAEGFGTVRRGRLASTVALNCPKGMDFLFRSLSGTHYISLSR